MSQDALASLRARSSAVEGRYETFFAGHPRITRDPELLERLAGELRQVAAAAAALPPSADRDALTASTADRVALYEREAAAIREAQAGGPDALEAHFVGEWSRFVFHRYQRHFAGQSRATRDLGLLAEMIADLKRLLTEGEALRDVPGAGDLGAALERVQRDLKLYLDERGEIVSARGAGTSEEQSDVLAAVANEQFAVYARHFAGKSRLSRRPALLQRVIDNLDVVADRMRLLRDGGFNEESLRKNIEVVESRAAFYRTELEAIRKARKDASLSELVSALGGAANEVFAEYRAGFAGQDRRTRDLSRLATLCDALDELGRQMDELDRARPDDTNSANLQIVLDTLRMYVREYDAIQEAQRGARA